MAFVGKIHSMKSYAHFRFWIIAGVAASIIACEKPLSLEVIDNNRELVVVSNFMPDQALHVVVSLSRDILVGTAATEFVDDAEVKLYRDGELVQELEFSGPKGQVATPFYTTNGFVPQVGVAYTITVDAPGYPTVAAKSEIPEPINLLSTSLSNLTFAAPEHDKTQAFTYDLLLRFEDPSKVQNYYHINLLQQFVPYEMVEGDTAFRAPVYRAARFDHRNNSNDQIAHLGGGVLLQDEGWDGTIIDYTLPVRQLHNPAKEKLGKLFVELRAVSEEYYRYFSALSRQQASENSPFVDPVILYDNIDGGQGVFAGFSTSSDSLIVRH